MCRLSCSNVAMFNRLLTWHLHLPIQSAALASDVIDLTMDDFESIVNKESLILVEFFAPW